MDLKLFISFEILPHKRYIDLYICTSISSKPLGIPSCGQRIRNQRVPIHRLGMDLRIYIGFEILPHKRYIDLYICTSISSEPLRISSCGQRIRYQRVPIHRLGMDLRIYIGFEILPHKRYIDLYICTSISSEPFGIPSCGQRIRNQRVPIHRLGMDLRAYIRFEIFSI